MIIFLHFFEGGVFWHQKHRASYRLGSHAACTAPNVSVNAL